MFTSNKPLSLVPSVFFIVQGSYCNCTVLHSKLCTYILRVVRCVNSDAYSCQNLYANNMHTNNISRYSITVDYYLEMPNVQEKYWKKACINVWLHTGRAAELKRAFFQSKFVFKIQVELHFRNACTCKIRSIIIYLRVPTLGILSSHARCFKAFLWAVCFICWNHWFFFRIVFALEL